MIRTVLILILIFEYSLTKGQDTTKCQKCFLSFVYPDSINVVDTLDKTYYYSKDTVLSFTMFSSELKPFVELNSFISQVAGILEANDSLFTINETDTFSIGSLFIGKRYNFSINSDKGVYNACMCFIYLKTHGIVNVFSFAKLNDEADEVNILANSVIGSISYFEPN